MSRRPPFEPIRYALQLSRSGKFATSDNLFLKWNDKHWEIVSYDDALRKALSWIIEDGDISNASAANAKAAHQTALIQLPALQEPTHISVIPVGNGYLHLDGSPVLKSHDKELGLRHTLGCDYLPSAPTPKMFENLLTRILPDPAVRNRVQEYIGYTLLPDARFQLAQIWIGSGANGKGTLANIVQALHGRAVAASPSKLDGFQASVTLGASLIYCDEAPPQNWCEQTIKSMIAGETVQIDRKYQSPITTRIIGKWLILANHVPSVKDQSNGFWRRFDIVPFGVEIPASERDPKLADRIIMYELTGVLNWALEGLQRLLERGRFEAALPSAMTAATQAARTETNSVHAWVSEASIERTTTTATSKSTVYTAYASWCKENGMLSVASPKFWKRLPDSLGEIVESRATTGAGRIRTCNILLP
ncbi:DNA primase family protein [Janthinobacterium psychrotolerans]|uniref:Putative DNA primase/helicase n=1 Tax=Janthinobacterium psychrotolerans TaxID=1747903 RepID=A0A1A7C532_9BURK|nr:phage/plasmid primase, P4 family [Janthinobacterium psychrotolerans]OBV39413.1 putative DNA primase/helicase [Janthinobacterium psychrotolerans]